MITANALLLATWTDQIQYYVDGLDDEPLKKLLNELNMQPINSRVKQFCSSQELNLENIFPFPDHVADTVKGEEFYLAHTSTRDVFVWCKKDSRKKIVEKFKKKGFTIEVNSELKDSASLKANTDIQNILGLDAGLVEVQDISSQLALSKIDITHDDVVWDCCAGSGGKAMHLADKHHGPIWLVSDKRTSIQHNLKKRMKSVTKYFAQAELDLLQNDEEHIVFNKLDGHIYETKHENVDLILLDAPCTGSGTWARNPEHLGAFQEDKIAKFASVQLALLKAAWKYLKKGGSLHYMTCSVYEAENENLIQEFVQSSTETKLVSQSYYGSGYKGDRLFKAHLTKM